MNFESKYKNNFHLEKYFKNVVCEMAAILLSLNVFLVKNLKWRGLLSALTDSGCI